MSYTIVDIAPPIVNVLLVDDDRDDYLIFKSALEHQVFRTHLERVSSGDGLFELLADQNATWPHVIFLDINMIGKNGYDCLLEMKESKRLDKIPIVIYSTCYEEFVADVLYDMGANFYIKKPAEFTNVRKLIEKALCFVTENEHYSPTRKNFVL